MVDIAKREKMAEAFRLTREASYACLSAASLVLAADRAAVVGGEKIALQDKVEQDIFDKLLEAYDLLGGLAWPPEAGAPLSKGV